ncbi:GTP cyclohydrolase FolE2 [Pseudomonas segetis]|uniref:GTP cyclohydrolase FolE2 n=1 Tax=Pseudomonas segetis TaxID=298908 RepID=A0A239HS06_9PSED|nr:GTP cyclohydrolase FolE2 [Pseudomonas segetis]SNS84060.1 GTP cyclohydrolase I [Pseudomonas segetis]
MNSQARYHQTMSDIAAQAAPASQTLDWVGMCNIDMPLRVEGQSTTGKVDAGVSLDDQTARGIHMSRLYLALQKIAQQPLSPSLLEEVLSDFLASHTGLSQRASLSICTDLLLQRPALTSHLSGWKAYPITIDAGLDSNGLHLELGVTLAYSSTCPCSAALARQLIQQRFARDFNSAPVDYQQVHAWLGSTDGIIATPHSQRSTAQIQLRLDRQARDFAIQSVIDRAEQALGTAVQTAVKRADEQAFALANGQNLMFCEDAARRLDLTLRTQPDITGFKLKVIHAESLHAHDAVAQSSWHWQ